MPRPDISRLLGFAALILAVLLATVGTASAHRLKVFASAIGNSIEGQAYFVGSGPAAGVDVTLRDAANTLLQSGKTDPDGKFALPVSNSGDIVVTVDAEDGHVARFTVAGGELDPAPTSAKPATNAVVPVAANASPTVPMADIEIAVARKIAPLAAQIDALESSLRVQDIVGGIGYIVGVFGLLAFLKSRRSPKDGAPKAGAPKGGAP
ncbi:hypothetical protein [Kaistia terrae]|uniref:Nickel transport protein n=1 Tax=Kaistia terrae TaxID=537017 RepID=A0ABW0PPU4_9HYPH|nr:hypothetical protein [Kaistia terrae]MCX5577855.1 hypothetical protein [Kaistia terrae]